MLYEVITIEVKYKFLKLKADWEIDAIVTDTGNVEDILKVKPLENSIVLSPWRFNIGLGYQYFTWGTADEHVITSYSIHYTKLYD